MSRSSAFSVVLDLDDDRKLEVNGNYTPGDPGQTSGPPERCYPPEGPELEIDNIWLIGSDDTTRVEASALITFFGLEETLDAKVLEKLADFDPGSNDPDEYNPE